MPRIGIGIGLESPAVVGVGGTLRDVSVVASGEITDVASPHSHVGKSFGIAAADRVLIAASVYKDGAGGSDYTGATFGGTAGTELSEAAASGALNVALHDAAVAAGVSGNIDIAVSGAGATLDSALLLLRMIGYLAAPFQVNQGLVGATSIARNIDVPAGGVVVAVCYRDGGVGGVTWTNVDKLGADLNWDTNQRQLSVAARAYVGAQSALPITAAKTEGGAIASMYMVVASFSPTP